jgi:hypothetical protein
MMHIDIDFDRHVHMMVQYLPPLEDDGYQPPLEYKVKHDLWEWCEVNLAAQPGIRAYVNKRSQMTFRMFFQNERDAILFKTWWL